MWIYFRSAPDAASEGGGAELWRTHIEGGEPERLLETGPRMGTTMESPDGSTLYASRGTELLRIPLGEDGRASGEPTTVATEVWGFSVSVLESGVYYCTTSGEVKRYDPASGATETLRRLEDAVNSGCSVSPDGNWLLYTRQTRAGNDLMLLESVE